MAEHGERDATYRALCHAHEHDVPKLANSVVETQDAVGGESASGSTSTAVCASSESTTSFHGMSGTPTLASFAAVEHERERDSHRNSQR